MTATRVCYYRRPNGYDVQVLDDNGQPVDEHQSGNLDIESTETVPPWHDAAVSQEKLLEYAERTARELATEHGLNPDDVFHDIDGENSVFEDPAYESVYGSDAPRP